MQLILTLAAIAVIVVLLVVFKKPADIAGIVGLAAVAAVAIFAFNTSLIVVGRAATAGLIRSFAVSLVVAASLLQMALMEKSGALRRVIIFIKTIANDSKVVQIILINIGFGTLMVAVGATPASLLPPILLAMGYSTTMAIALPAIGYDSLCTYALLGAPIVVFVDAANGFLIKEGIIAASNPVTLSEVGRVFAWFLPLASVLVGLCMMWITGRWEAIKKGMVPCLIAGAVIGVIAHFTSLMDNLVVLTGIFCGIGVIVAMLAYLKLTGKAVVDKSRLTDEERQYEQQYPLLKALSPWILLIVLILIMNIPQDIFRVLYREWLFPIRGVSPDGSAIDTRFLWNAYTWILVSTVLALFILRPSTAQLKETGKVWLRRAPRPVFAAAVFFSIGEVMRFSGFDAATGGYRTDNMIKVLANASASAFQSAYGAVAGLIGLFGGFITGSEASTIGMFGQYAMSTAKNIGMDRLGILIIAAGMAFGGGLASIISPAKLQNAAASIDRLGEENQVIRMAFVFAAIFAAFLAGFVLLLLYLF